MINKKISSPLSLGANATFIESISIKKIVENYKKSFNIDVKEYFQELDFVSVYQCDKTSYKFYYPYFIYGRSNFYMQLEKFEWYYMPWKWEHKISIQYLRDDLNVLEVGCAHGTFLEKISKDFKLKDVIGLEMNESTKIFNNEFQILNENIENFKLSNFEKFDIVCSFEVLEHISNVYEFLNSKIQCLKQGGKLIIAVPNNESFVKNSRYGLNCPPHHMGLWDSKSLENLVEIFPLKHIKTHYEELQDYHVEVHLNSFYYNSGPDLFNKLKRKFDKISGRYNSLKQSIENNKTNIVGHTILVVYEKN